MNTSFFFLSLSRIPFFSFFKQKSIRQSLNAVEKDLYLLVKKKKTSAMITYWYVHLADELFRWVCIRTAF